MQVKLEMAFESLEELKGYLDSTLTNRGCCCAKPVPDPMPVDLEPKPVPVQPAPPMVQPPAPVPANELEPIAPPPTVTAPLPVEAAPMPTPQADTQVSAPSPEVSTAAHTYKLDDIARAGASLVGLGKQAELGALLQRFGIASLPELPVDKYGEMARALREMGARI